MLIPHHCKGPFVILYQTKNLAQRNAYMKLPLHLGSETFPKKALIFAEFVVMRHGSVLLQNAISEWLDTAL